MTCKTPATASAVSLECHRSAGCASLRRAGSVAGLGFAALTFLTGCGGGGGSLMELTSSEQFKQQVLWAKQPVLVLFFKKGCSRCGSLEAAMEQLTKDYRGRVGFTKYYLKDFLWTVTNPELQSKYKIDGYPTVSLFVNGWEKKRWVMFYDISSYRKALDEALRSPTKRTTAAPPVVSPGPPADPVVAPGNPANCGCSWGPGPSRISRSSFRGV